MGYEEPVDTFDAAAYCQLHNRVIIPIAAGERLYTRYGFQQLIENRGVDIVQPDPGACGGLREIWNIEAIAETHSMRIAPHNCGGPVLTAAAVQMAACLSNLAILEMFPYRLEMHYDIVENPLEKRIQKGAAGRPRRTGARHHTEPQGCGPFPRCASVIELTHGTSAVIAGKPPAGQVKYQGGKLPQGPKPKKKDNIFRCCPSFWSG